MVEIKDRETRSQCVRLAVTIIESHTDVPIEMVLMQPYRGRLFLFTTRAAEVVRTNIARTARTAHMAHSSSGSGSSSDGDGGGGGGDSGDGNSYDSSCVRVPKKHRDTVLGYLQGAADSRIPDRHRDKGQGGSGEGSEGREGNRVVQGAENVGHGVGWIAPVVETEELIPWGLVTDEIVYNALVSEWTSEAEGEWSETTARGNMEGSMVRTKERSIERRIAILRPTAHHGPSGSNTAVTLKTSAQKHKYHPKFAVKVKKRHNKVWSMLGVAMIAESVLASLYSSPPSPSPFSSSPPHSSPSHPSQPSNISPSPPPPPNPPNSSSSSNPFSPTPPSTATESRTESSSSSSKESRSSFSETSSSSNIARVYSAERLWYLLFPSLLPLLRCAQLSTSEGLSCLSNLGKISGRNQFIHIFTAFHRISPHFIAFHLISPHPMDDSILTEVMFYNIYDY